MTRLLVECIDQTPKSYPIQLELGALTRLRKFLPLDSYSQIIVLTDTNLSESILPKVLSQLPPKKAVIEIQPGESAKNIDSLQKIWNELIALGADRKSLLLNLGGGVIGDLGGFAASTFLRGIDFAQIPCTLLAQVDASIGGKLGIDFGGLKNSIGVIRQPVAVICDPEILRSLPRRELISGYAEVIKHGAIADAEYFNLACKKAVTDLSEEELCQIIIRSCQIKLGVVQSDVREEGKRKILNFGHTFGHALEVISLDGPAPLTHGEAISLGMCFEALLSHRLGFLSEEALHMLSSALVKQGLPTSLADQDKRNHSLWTHHAIIEKMRGDKKTSFGTIRWSLIDAIGSCRYDVEVSDQELSATLETWSWGGNA